MSTVLQRQPTRVYPIAVATSTRVATTRAFTGTPQLIALEEPVLILTQQYDLGQLLATCLEGYGYATDLTESYQAACAEVKWMQPGAAVIIEELRAAQQFALTQSLHTYAPHLVILLLSNAASHQARCHGLASGATRYLVYPIELGIIREHLAACLH